MDAEGRKVGPQLCEARRFFEQVGEQIFGRKWDGHEIELGDDDPNDEVRSARLERYNFVEAAIGEGIRDGMVRFEVDLTRLDLEDAEDVFASWDKKKTIDLTTEKGRKLFAQLSGTALLYLLAQQKVRFLTIDNHGYAATYPILYKHDKTFQINWKNSKIQIAKECVLKSYLIQEPLFSADEDLLSELMHVYEFEVSQPLSEYIADILELDLYVIDPIGVRNYFDQSTKLRDVRKKNKTHDWQIIYAIIWRHIAIKQSNSAVLTQSNLIDCVMGYYIDNNRSPPQRSQLALAAGYILEQFSAKDDASLILAPAPFSSKKKK